VRSLLQRNACAIDLRASEVSENNSQASRRTRASCRCPTAVHLRTLLRSILASHRITIALYDLRSESVLAEYRGRAYVISTSERLSQWLRLRRTRKPVRDTRFTVLVDLPQLSSPVQESDAGFRSHSGASSPGDEHRPGRSRDVQCSMNSCMRASETVKRHCRCKRGTRCRILRCGLDFPRGLERNGPGRIKAARPLSRFPARYLEGCSTLLLFVSRYRAPCARCVSEESVWCSTMCDVNIFSESHDPAPPCFLFLQQTTAVPN